MDAPVLGTREPAEKGGLTILASGPDGALERCEPLFEATGVRTVRLGPAYADAKGSAMIEREFPTSFPLALAHKDAELVLEAARTAGADLGLMPVVRERLARALQHGHGDEDLAAVILGTTERAGTGE